jgi:uncharacterized sporulation protein YeaH/YhbH (DUF444 family)
MSQIDLERTLKNRLDRIMLDYAIIHRKVEENKKKIVELENEITNNLASLETVRQDEADLLADIEKVHGKNYSLDMNTRKLIRKV